MLSKVVLLTLLAVTGLAIWLLPRTRLAAGRIGEKTFVATYALGALCGAAGLAALFLWPEQARQWRLWELSLAPLVLVSYCIRTDETTRPALRRFPLRGPGTGAPA